LLPDDTPHDASNNMGRRQCVQSHQTRGEFEKTSFPACGGENIRCIDIKQADDQRQLVDERYI
jgi:hypothetical protein